jgi:hypothetical protein
MRDLAHGFSVAVSKGAGATRSIHRRQQSVEAAVDNFFRAPRAGQAGPEGRAHFSATTAIEISREAVAEVVLPARAQNGIPVARFAELEIDEVVEDRLAVVLGCGMTVASREVGDDEDRKY